MANTTFTLTKGEVGKVLRFTLEDADGPFALSGWNIALNAMKFGSDTAAIDDAACVNDADQINNPGVGTYTFDETTADIEVGRYHLQFKATNGSNVLYFPTEASGQMAQLVVVEPLP